MLLRAAVCEKPGAAKRRELQKATLCKTGAAKRRELQKATLCEKTAEAGDSITWSRDTRAVRASPSSLTYTHDHSNHQLPYNQGNALAMRHNEVADKYARPGASRISMSLRRRRQDSQEGPGKKSLR